MSPLFRRRAPIERLPLTSVRTTPATESTPDTGIWDPPAGSDPDEPSRSDCVQQTLVADVCVIGLGAAGLSAVLELARAGADVVGVDAGTGDTGVSARNLGMLRAGFAAPYDEAVSRLGRRRARALYAATVDELLAMHDNGHDDVAWTGSVRSGAADDERAALERDGFTVHADDAGGLRFGHDGVFDPASRVARLRREARDAGARLISETRALHIGDRGTHHGEVQCRSIIIAVDGGLEQTLPALAHDVTTVRLPLAATAPTAKVIDTPQVTDAGTTGWRQLDDGRIIAARLTPGGNLKDLEHQIAARAPDAAVTHRWHADGAFTDDRVPRVLRVGATVAVGAYSGNGNVWGPLLGRSAAELALGRRARVTTLLAG